MDSLAAGKDFGTGEGGVLVTQERMTDTDVAKVDANAKSDAPDPSDASNIDTPNINVKRGMGETCAVAIALSRRVSLIQQALLDSQLDG